MPLINNKSSSDLLYKNERRMLYAHRLIKEQSFAQGETNRIDLVSGNAGVNSSSAILPMKEGAFFMTPEEQTTILDNNRILQANYDPEPAPIVIPDPVASYLPENGTDTNWSDSAGTLNATMTGTPTYSSSLGYTFNGSTQYGTIPNANGINNFDNTDAYTVEVWFNPSSGQPLGPTDQTSIIEKWNSNNQSRYPYIIRYQESTNTAFVAAYDGRIPEGFRSVTLSGVPTNTWVQVVGVFNFTNGINLLTGYRNGVSGGTASLGSMNSVSNTSEVGIAARLEPPPLLKSKLLIGSVGLFRIYNTALSAVQVAEIFTNTRALFGI
jgi:hypothetical protein